MKVVWSPFADSEIQSAIDHYEQQRTGLGGQFLVAVRRTAAGIGEWPSAGKPVGASFRARRVKRFPYSLIYTQVGPMIWIVSAPHQRRMPGYWRSRWEVREPIVAYGRLAA
jgi:plasmid stabilization system protein ParE